MRVARAMGDVGGGSVGRASLNVRKQLLSPTQPSVPTARNAAQRIQQRFRKFMDDRAKKKTASLVGARREHVAHVMLDSDDSSEDELVDAGGFDGHGNGTGTHSPHSTHSWHSLLNTSSSNTKLLKCSFLVVAWFGLSTSLALYNKTLFGQRKGGFPAPLLLTSVQFFMQWLLAKLLLEYVVPSLKPKRQINWTTYLLRVAPVGIAMGLDIGLSNLSLVYVTVSFYTLAKTSSIIFLLFSAFIMRVEPVSLRLTMCVLILCLGEVLVVRGETQYNALGAALCFLAAAASGVRWVLSQKVLHVASGGNKGSARVTTSTNTSNSSLRKSHGMHHPPVMLSVMMPVMSLIVFIFSTAKEKWWATLPGSDWLSSPLDLLIDLLITLFGATMALCMSMAEFELVKETTAMTVSVIGTGKDVFTVFVAVLVMKDTFGAQNFIGMVFVVLGIVFYNWHKRVSAAELLDQKGAAVELKMELAELATSGGGAGDEGGGDDGDASLLAAQKARDRLAAELGIGAPARKIDGHHKIPIVTTRRDSNKGPSLPIRKEGSNNWGR